MVFSCFSGPTTTKDQYELANACKSLLKLTSIYRNEWISSPCSLTIHLTIQDDSIFCFVLCRGTTHSDVCWFQFVSGCFCVTWLCRSARFVKFHRDPSLIFDRPFSIWFYDMIRPYWINTILAPGHLFNALCCLIVRKGSWVDISQITLRFPGCYCIPFQFIRCMMDSEVFRRDH